MPRYAMCAMLRKDTPGNTAMTQHLVIKGGGSSDEAKGRFMSELETHPDTADRAICGILVLEINDENN